MAKLGVLFYVFYALVMCLSVQADPIAELQARRTKESLVLADAMKELKTKHGYSKDVLSKAFETCKDKHGSEMVACIINSIHVERLVLDHKLELCLYEYLSGTLVECSTACFARYNVQCLECVGNLIPNLVDCIKNRPPAYMT